MTNESNEVSAGTDPIGAAVDAAVRAGFDGRRLAEAPEADAAARVIRLLDAMADLGLDDGRRELLVDVTMARVLRRSGEDSAGRVAAGALDARSAEAFDELVEAGWDPGRAGEAGARLGGLAALLAQAGVGQGAARAVLVDRTMGRIEASDQARRDRFRLAPAMEAAACSSARWRLPDLAAVAAILLFGAAVMWPMLVSLRANGQEQMCASRLHAAGISFSLFAGDHDGRLPASPEASNSTAASWWAVGERGRSHSANLFHLVRSGYATIGDLACPGNESAPVHVTPHELARMHDWAAHDEVSYSYQLFGASAPRLGADGGRRVLLTDRSPVVARAKAGDLVEPEMASRNHAGRGQHTLRHDGRVKFLRTPYLPSGDNIWLPRSVEGDDLPVLRGTELPAGGSDAFVGP